MLYTLYRPTVDKNMDISLKGDKMNNISRKTRIVKEYEERKREITDTAARMFIQKGYEKCSVNEIITEVGIAKGTFYHYFKTKEEVLDAVIEKFTEKIRKKAKKIAEDFSLEPQDKLIGIFFSMNIEEEIGDKLISDMHKPENALMHQKSLSSAIEALTPVLVSVIEEGIRDKVFSCLYPKQYMQIFLASAITLTDKGIFDLDDLEEKKLIKGMISLLEKMLDTREGEFLRCIEKI